MRSEVDESEASESGKNEICCRSFQCMGFLWYNQNVEF
jgi:hypothetical protein